MTIFSFKTILADGTEYDSTVISPSADFVSIENEETLSLYQPYEIIWNNALGEDERVSIELIFNYSNGQDTIYLGDKPDTGSTIIDSSEFYELLIGHPQELPHYATIVLTRKTTGGVNSSFRGGSISCYFYYYKSINDVTW